MKVFVEKKGLWVLWTVHGTYWKNTLLVILCFLFLSVCLVPTFESEFCFCVLLFFFFTRVSGDKCNRGVLFSNVWPCFFDISVNQWARALFMDPQISFLIKFFIKNGSHSTIHTFKNYFATVFSVFSFSKINSIQTHPYKAIFSLETKYCRTFRCTSNKMKTG